LDFVLFYHAFQVKSTQIYFDTYFPCISNCLAKLYTFIGCQHAEKFENHWSKSLQICKNPTQYLCCNVVHWL